MITAGREEQKKKIERRIEEMIKDKPRLLSSYVTHCLGSGQQPTTIKLYITYIISFMDFIGNELTNESVKEILPMDISNYLNHIRNKSGKRGRCGQTSTSYRATAHSALKHFFDFLLVNKLVNENPVASIKRPKVIDVVSQDHLSINQMGLVIRSVKRGTSATGKSKTHEESLKTRNMAIVRMLLELGIRCGALTAMDVDNVDLENSKIYYKDKGEKRFEKPISKELKLAISEWLVDREKMEPKTNALFISEKKNRCCYGTIANVVKKYTYDATGKEMSVHKMRHSAITAVYELNGKDIVHASKFAGHSNVITTQRYINTDYTEKDQTISAKLGSMI